MVVVVVISAEILARRSLYFAINALGGNLCGGFPGMLSFGNPLKRVHDHPSGFRRGGGGERVSIWQVGQLGTSSRQYLP